MHTLIELAQKLDTTAIQSDFCGVVRVDKAGEEPFVKAYGLADRANQLPNNPDTKIRVASVTKGFTALVIAKLIEQGKLDWETSARSLLGTDLPLIDDRVTVAQLLQHRSGIGDYIDESEGEIDDYVMGLPVHTFTTTESYLPILDNRPQVFEPGADFAYNNSGYVVLALLAERAAGERKTFPELVQELIFDPAGMKDSGFRRSDEPQPGDAVNYLSADGLRTSVLHLPLIGSGDGGVTTTASDLALFWRALQDAKIASPSFVERLLEPVSVIKDVEARYASGFWRALDSELVYLEGYDAGVGAITVMDPATGTSATAISNRTGGYGELMSEIIDWGRQTHP